MRLELEIDVITWVHVNYSSLYNFRESGPARDNEDKVSAVTSGRSTLKWTENAK